MNYIDGQQIKLGDEVKIASESVGIVVGIISERKYSRDFPEEEWNYLKQGFLVDTSDMGLVHYPSPSEEVKLLNRTGEV